MRLKCPFPMLISGPSNCGKTTFVIQLLNERKNAFKTNSNNIYWFYKVYQDAFKHIEKEITSFENEMCTIAWLEKNSVPPNSTIVIDDMALESTEDTAKLFSIASHHFKINIIFLCQNLFTKNKYFCDISLNSTYVVLFKNIGDKQQISNFAKQFAPGKNKEFLQMFNEATEEPHSYLILDNHQKTIEDHQIISNYLQDNNKSITLWIFT